MSIRNAFLALLTEQPMHGYQLRQEFEARTSGTWPLNIGQAYTTVNRLERDGLVTRLASTDSEAAEQFALTDKGRDEADQWWSVPIPRTTPARDELAIKLAMAVTVTGVDVVNVVQSQRTETMRALHEYTRLKRRSAASDASRGAPSGDDDFAWSLVLDSLIFQAEAEIRWLDHIESSVLRRQQLAQSRASRSTSATTLADAHPTTAGGQR